jgi:hypothetical protein
MKHSYTKEMEKSMKVGLLLVLKHWKTFEVLGFVSHLVDWNNMERHGHKLPLWHH